MSRTGLWRRGGLLAAALMAAVAAAAGAETVAGIEATAAAKGPQGPEPGADARLKKAAAAPVDPALSAAADARSVPAAPYPAAGKAAAGVDDCATLPQRAAKLNLKGRALAACVTVGSARTWSDDPGDVTTQDIIELPDFCTERAFDGWWMTRKHTCMIRAGKIQVRELPRGGLIGELEFFEINYAYTSASIPTWAQQLEIRVFAGWGPIVGTMVQGQATCSNSCSLVRSTFPAQLAQRGRDAEGEAFFDTTATAGGEVARATSTFFYQFTNPVWQVQPAGFSVTTPTIRCDNALPGNTPPGCVLPDYAPAMVYSHTGAFPELARHIGEAQASGLPGAYPDGARLNRLIDPVLQDRNRSRSCPDASSGGYPRPAGRSCDEYPMASTRQGAFTAVPQGTARSFEWCQVNEPASAGPVGYSVCMIDEDDNSIGGSALGTFYTNERVINDDEFYVWITDGTGGGGGGSGAPVPPTDRPPSVNAGPDVAGDEGAPVRLHGSAVDAESTPTVRWSYDPRDDVDHGATCTFADPTSPSTDITCTDDGTFTVTLTALDGVNEPVSDSATVTLSNVAPTVRITAPQAWQVFKARTPVTVTATVTDPGSNDTHTCQVGWDDTTTSDAAASSNACTLGHSFAHAGMFTLDLTVTDDDGGQDTAGVMVVVYDPDDGWTNLDAATATPAGALAGGPNTTGWTWAHLTAKYYTQNNPPTGEAKLWIPDVFRMEPTSRLEWLVVTPDGKVAAKGTSTTADGGEVGFVLYGYRGCPAAGPDCQPGPDRMRAVLWPRSTGAIPGDTVTYDNQRGADYDIDRTNPQPLTAGSVQIHH